MPTFIFRKILLCLSCLRKSLTYYATISGNSIERISFKLLQIKNFFLKNSFYYCIILKVLNTFLFLQTYMFGYEIYIWFIFWVNDFALTYFVYAPISFDLILIIKVINNIGTYKNNISLLLKYIFRGFQLFYWFRTNFTFYERDF